MEQQLRDLTKALIRRREMLVTVVTVRFGRSTIASCLTGRRGTDRVARSGVTAPSRAV